MAVEQQAHRPILTARPSALGHNAAMSNTHKGADKHKGNSISMGAVPLSDLLRLPQGPVQLSNYDPRVTTGFPGAGKADAAPATDALAPELNDLQERLYANGRARGDQAPRILLVLQGRDTSGKGGVIRHAIGLVDPQGVQIKAFGPPTKEEHAHPFLWRVSRDLPRPGLIGIFDRSHYEDVLVARVARLVTKPVWSARYESINRWEARQIAAGTVMIKCFLQISAEAQKSRLLARLEDETKHWKYDPGDVDIRAQWPAYTDAYEAVLERCNTDHAPWYLIPADRKWYRNWAVAQILLEQLRGLGLAWPPGNFDVETERRRLLESR